MEGRDTPRRCSVELVLAILVIDLLWWIRR
jgi:hypothetical protein